MSFIKKTYRQLRGQFFLAIGVWFGRTFSVPMRRLLVIAPHPDDEVFGCAGLITRSLVSNGCVKVIVLTGGGKSHAKCCNVTPGEIAEKRRALTLTSGAVLGLSLNDYTFLDWPDGALDTLPHPEVEKTINQLAGLINACGPDAVFCPHPFEGWADHVAAERLVREALGKVAGKVSLYHYCVWFWHSMPLARAWQCDWKHAFILDISEMYEKKQKAIEAYMASCAPCGKPWSGVLPKELLWAFTWKKEMFFIVS